MLTSRLMVVAALSLTVLAEGSSLDLVMPAQVSDERAPLVAENLLIGALKPHAVVEIDEDADGRIAIFAEHDCTCFGFPAKAGDQVMELVFDKDIDGDQALAFARKLLAGDFHGQVKAGPSVRASKNAKAEAKAKAEADAAAKARTAKAEADAKAKAEADAKAKAEADAKAKAEAEARAAGAATGGRAPQGPATAGGHNQA